MTDDPIRYAPLTRSVPVTEVAFTDGHLEAMLVPWDTPITVYDEAEPYQEGFRSTAFDLQFQKYPESIHEVRLTPQHGSSELLGRARQLDVTDTGLHGVMQVLPSKRDDVQTMVEMGVDSVSIEFVPLQKRPRDGEIRWRDRALLQAVAMTSMPAYADSKVLAMRAEQLEQHVAAERDRRIAELDEFLSAAKSSRWHHE